MDLSLKVYSVKIIRECGIDPITGEQVEYAEQLFDIEATSIQAAYSISCFVCTLNFTGQIKRTFINDVEYFNNKF